MAIGVILNPKSRRNVRDPGAALRLARQLGDHGVVREARSRDELHRIAEDFKRLQIDVLGISGGDGTNHVTITGFLNVYGARAIPQLAFLRGGTMNTVADSVGVRRGRPEGLLGRLVRQYAVRSSRPLAGVERHVVKVGDDYGFLFGVGAVYGYLAEYYRHGEPTPLIAAKTLLHGAASAMIGGEMAKRMTRPFRGHVTLDDGTRWEERDYVAVTGGTIDHIGLNFKPFPRFAEKPNAFQLLGIHTTRTRLVRDLPRIFRGRPLRPDHAYDVCTSSARITSRDGHVRYMIDGDLHEKEGDLEITIGPKVRILVGA